MDGLVPFTVVVGAVLFCSEMRGITLDGSQTPDPGLILNGVELLMGSLSRVNCFIGLYARSGLNEGVGSACLL